MSQCGSDEGGKEVYGSRSKTTYEPYTDDELASDEYFWNQLQTIVFLKNEEYFNRFMRSRDDYIEKMSGM